MIRSSQIALPPLETATPEESEIIRRFVDLTVYADQVHADVIPQHQRVILAVIRAARIPLIRKIAKLLDREESAANPPRNFSGREVDPDCEHSDADPGL